MLGQCRADLGDLLPAVPEEAGDYFARLRMLADLLLAAAR
jgi:hypothetical protein